MRGDPDLLPVIWLLLACRNTECPGFVDLDGDGFGGEQTVSCDVVSVQQAGDCDDTQAGQNPDAIEVCDGVDQDCDGQADEGLDWREWYVDGDGDGFGAGQPITACEGDTDVTGDCDDTDGLSYPAATEVPYDGVDQDCDGADLVDVDDDGSPWPDDCDDNDAARSPGWVELCGTGVDEDCDGVVDDDCQYFGGVVDREPTVTVWGIETAARPRETSRTGTSVSIWGGTFVVFHTPYFHQAEGYRAEKGEFTVDDSEWSHPCEPAFIAFSPSDELVLCSSRGDQPYTGAVLFSDAAEGEIDASALVAWDAPSLFRPDAGAFVGADQVVLADRDPGTWPPDPSRIALVSMPLSGEFDVASTGTFILPDASGQVGFDVLSADITGSGEPDLVTTGVQSGGDMAVYVFAGPISADRRVADADVMLLDPNENGLDNADMTLADMDGDGHADLTLSYGERHPASYSDTFIFHGPLSTANLEQPDATLSVPNGQTASMYGWSDATPVAVGDMNGDTHPDLVISTPNQQNGAGAVWLFLGPVSGTVDEVDADGWMVGQTEQYTVCEGDYEYCWHPGSRLGWSLAMSDYDGDGYDDLLVGAPFEELEGPDKNGPGAAYLFSGAE
jgi:hypothetical protein